MIHFYTDKTIPAGVLIEQSIRQLSCVTDEFPQTRHLVIQFAHTQYYLPEQPQLELLALLSMRLGVEASAVIEGSVFLATPEWMNQLQCLSDESSNSLDPLQQFCCQHSLPWVRISDPWMLAPIHIPKPWGQEIWYTGIEARGQAGVMADVGSIPLPWLLELVSERIGLPERSAPLLLKVLDPLADEIYGDLYFELHQKKQEVYVVTNVDEKAWPDRVGAIQLGFAAQMRQSYKSNDEFKQAYLDSVKAYEQVRRLVDSLLDQKKVVAHSGLTQPASSSQLKRWISELSQHHENKELLNSERSLRQTMNSFVANHPLKVGDVVTVPKLVPHALQHGVRVVEFQTPVYERKILSFGQKVLTQSHWDTEDALELANLDFAQLESPELITVTSGLQIERIVNFDDFEVLRVQLDGSYIFQAETYSVLMVLDGQLHLNLAQHNDIGVGQAALLPVSEKNWQITSCGSCLFLLASPKRSVK